MASRSFGLKSPAKPHLVASSGGMGGEINDLRSDTEEGFLAMEAEVSGDALAQANIRLNTQPTAHDTITIGADVYEFLAALTDAFTAGGTVKVLRGATAAAARTNIINAINGGTGLGTTYTPAGTEAVLASIYNTDYLHITPKDEATGLAVVGTQPNIALSDALTAVVAWDQENLGNTGGSVGFKKEVHKITVDATNLAADFDVVSQGVIRGAKVLYVTDAAGVVDVTGKAASITVTVVPARNAVTVDFNGGGTDPVATDKVYLEITYV